MDRSSRGIRCSQKAALRLTGLAFLFSLVAASSALAQDEPPPEPVEPEVQEIGLLFTQNATSGSLRALEGKDSDRYVLTLENPGRQVIWFQDRPGRQSGHLPLKGFMEAWEGYGFVEDPPNAALSVLDGADHQDTAVLTLGKPRYNAAKRKLRFPVRAESEATGNLAHFEHAHDPGAIESFGHAALFIDDATAPVINGCVLRPFAFCLLANLAGANLAGLDLRDGLFTNSNFSHANLVGANLSGAGLTGVDFSGADLTRVNIGLGAFGSRASVDHVNFTNANLTNANLTGGRYTATKFINANLSGANLSGLLFYLTNFYGANLTGANTSGTTYVCWVTMPNGHNTGKTGFCPYDGPQARR